MIQLFVNIVTLSNILKPVAQGLGAGKIYWVTLKARTNGFKLSNSMTAIDGFSVVQGGAIDIPISDLVYKVGVINLENLYWNNAVADSNCVVELIGMREV